MTWGIGADKSAEAMRILNKQTDLYVEWAKQDDYLDAVFNLKIIEDCYDHKVHLKKATYKLIQSENTK